jgi:hypothetical protein
MSEHHTRRTRAEEATFERDAVERVESDLPRTCRGSG